MNLRFDDAYLVAFHLLHCIDACTRLGYGESSMLVWVSRLDNLKGTTPASTYSTIVSTTRVRRRGIGWEARERSYISIMPSRLPILAARFSQIVNATIKTRILTQEVLTYEICNVTRALGTTFVLEVTDVDSTITL